VRDIVCIGASSGGLEAIQDLVRGLPADLPAAVFIVRHIAPDAPGLLPEILQPYSSLPIAEAVHGERIQRGRITIAPPDRHLLLDRHNVHVTTGPKENWTRPAVDPLFRSVAQFHGPRSIGVILSGKLDDGTAGLWALKRRGGFAVVQSPEDAAVADMPKHALAAVEVDVVAGAEQIGAAMADWCRRTSQHAPLELVGDTVAGENAILFQQPDGAPALDTIGVSFSIVCPDCGGQLWQMKEGPLRFRCHVGHAQSAHTLMAQQREVVEAAGWQLVRALEEDSTLVEHVLGGISPRPDGTG
jgi:two-component system, chemotaxis family, protein-glutamate methylesterase/glutaminase